MDTLATNSENLKRFRVILNICVERDVQLPNKMVHA